MKYTALPPYHPLETSTASYNTVEFFMSDERTLCLSTWSSLDLQWARSWLSSTSPVIDNWTPYSDSLFTSLGLGLCHVLSHQVGGRSGVTAHWFGWCSQLKGPAYVSQIWLRPTWVKSPCTSRLLCMLLKNVKFPPGGSWPSTKDLNKVLQAMLGWDLAFGKIPNHGKLQRDRNTRICTICVSCSQCCDELCIGGSNTRMCSSDNCISSTRC